jgi:drug/metabolite transporter (DMT)-like permease
MKLKSPLQVIIDSQPLTVAVLASLLFGESIGAIGAGGLVLGVIGLLLLEVCILLMHVKKISICINVESRLWTG